MENTESMETLQLRIKILQSNLSSIIRENDFLRDKLEEEEEKTNLKIIKRTASRILLNELILREENNGKVEKSV